MAESLTLEKMEVAKRLANLETSVALMIQEMKMVNQSNLEMIKSNRDNISKLSKIVIGNGEPGLVGYVNDLLGLKKHIIAFWTMAVGAVVKYIMDMAGK